MKWVFSDTLYWVAIFNPKDQWAGATAQAEQRLGQFQIVTTDEVLTEFLTAMSGSGPNVRREAALFVRSILEDESVVVLRQDRLTFLAGLELYEKRPDKGYSLVDCISMAAMGRQGLSEVLTHDHHFAQEGFFVLIPDTI